MSFEAVAWVRRIGLQHVEAQQKMLTVPTDNVEAARDAFRQLGYQVRGLTILTQKEATAIVARM